MTTDNTAICDALDRFFELGNVHRECTVLASNNGSAKVWSGFCKGTVTHICVVRGDKFHVRYVPRENVQWLFDLTDQKACL